MLADAEELSLSVVINFESFGLTDIWLQLKSLLNSRIQDKN